jgi:hypothetical protein
VFFVGIPLLIIALAIYNMIAFLTPGVQWSEKVVTVPLLSGAEWSMTIGDALIVLALLMLMMEIVKAARRGKSMVDHVLSLIVLGIAVGELLRVPQAANSTFAILTVICLVDLLGGYSMGMRRAAARRAVAPIAPVPPPPPPTPAPQPAPPPPAPSASPAPGHLT